MKFKHTGNANLRFKRFSSSNKTLWVTKISKEQFLKFMCHVHAHWLLSKEDWHEQQFV